jgi:hypothetical protein
MLKEEYAEYCAECRWTGQQPLTFARWVGEEYGDPRTIAQERMAQLYDDDILDLY